MTTAFRHVARSEKSGEESYTWGLKICGGRAVRAGVCSPASPLRFQHACIKWYILLRILSLQWDNIYVLGIKVCLQLGSYCKIGSLGVRSTDHSILSLSFQPIWTFVRDFSNVLLWIQWVLKPNIWNFIRRFNCVEREGLNHFGYFTDLNDY